MGIKSRKMEKSALRKKEDAKRQKWDRVLKSRDRGRRNRNRHTYWSRFVQDS